MTWDDVHDARRVFRCLLDAIGHPGTPVPFPKVGIPPVAAVLLSLVDDSTTLCLPEGEAAEAFRAHGTAHYVPPA